MRVPRDPLEAFRQGEIVGRVVTYCEQLATGTKLIGQLVVRRCDKSLVRQTVKSEGCRVHFGQCDDQQRSCATLYCHDFALALLRDLEREEGSREDGCPTALGIWTAGKLFGYSDYEVGKFLAARGYVVDSVRSADIQCS